MRRTSACVATLLVAAAAFAGDADDKALLDAVPESPKDVVAKIDELSSDLVARERFDYGDPKIDAIAKLGRPALGELVRILRDWYGEEERKAHVVAKLAFARIATKDDVPVVAALVRLGHAEAAFALRDVKTPEASDVIADAVRRGLDHDLCFAIQARGFDERVGRALAAFLASQSNDDQASLVGVAALAAGRAGATESVAPIKAFVAKTKDARARARCFVGLARLGDADGIEGLVASLEKPADPETGNLVGWSLNEVSGRAEFKGGFDAATKQLHGNHAEAAKAYRAWWTTAKEKVKFDPATRKWTW
jgi:HEAT repeat protein